MEVTKEITVDKVEIVGQDNIIQVRELIALYDDSNNIVSKSFHRKIIRPGDDYSNEDPKVQEVCKAVHTDELLEKLNSSKNKAEE